MDVGGLSVGCDVAAHVGTGLTGRGICVFGFDRGDPVIVLAPEVDVELEHLLKNFHAERASESGPLEVAVFVVAVREVH